MKVKVGDLVVGDSRILHAAHSNESGNRRTVITLWFHPNFTELPEGMRAAFVMRCDPLPADWTAGIATIVRVGADSLRWR